MTIIRDLDESGNVTEPSTGKNLMNMWEYCMQNSRCGDGTLDYKLFETRMFGSYKSTSDSHSYSDIDHDSFLPYAFSGTSRLLMASSS